ncbi:MAG: HD domain-containing phosphohydrolase [Eubacteriales bacterium]
MGNVKIIDQLTDTAVNLQNILSLELQNARTEVFLNTIFTFLETILINPDYHDSVKKGLSLLGAATEVDRVYYWENSYDDKNKRFLASQIYEWNSDGTAPQADNPDLQNLPLESLGDFVATLMKEEIFTSIVKDIEDDFTRNILSEQNIVSILVVPIFVQKKFFGFVGFDECQIEKLWSEREKLLLKVFSLSLSKSIERDMLKKSIERAEQNLKNFFNTINDLLFVLDMEGNIIHTNETVIKRLGFSQEELIGQSVLSVHPEKRRAEAGQITQNMLEGKAEFCPVPVVTKRGVEIPVETRVFFGEWDGKPALFGVTKDITDLKKSEEKFAKAFNSQSVLMAISTVEDGIYLDVNDTFLTTLGYTRDEVIGKGSEELNIFADQDIRERVKNDFLAGRLGQNEEIKIVGKDKTIFTGIFNIELIAVDNTACFLTNMVNITARKMVEDKRLRRVMGSVIDVLVSTVESRDPYTSGHQKRVSDLSRAVAAEMGMSPSRVEEIRIAGEVHDLGKVSIPADILSMPRKLKKQEFALIMTHSQNGYEILKDVNFDWPIAEIVYQHHERMDGSGYPRGLKGDEICMDARIICVADVVEAMSSHRPYRPALGIEPALSEISQGRGTRYDSHVVDACIRVFREHHYQFVSE